MLSFKGQKFEYQMDYGHSFYDVSASVLCGFILNLYLTIC